MNRYDLHHPHHRHHAVGFRQKDADWSGVVKLAAVVGVGVVGYIVYRQFFVTAGSFRGAKRAFSGEGT